MDPFVSDAQTWAMTQFGTADLHDKRRTDRLVSWQRKSPQIRPGVSQSRPNPGMI